MLLQVNLGVLRLASLARDGGTTDANPKLAGRHVCLLKRREGIPMLCDIILLPVMSGDPTLPDYRFELYVEKFSLKAGNTTARSRLDLGRHDVALLTKL